MVLKALRNLFAGNASREGEHSANNGSDNELTREENDHWAKRARELASGALPTAWSDHEYVNAKYIHPMVSGDPRVGWLEATAKRYFQTPVDKALSLGCGGGNLECHALHIDMARHFDAFDASPGSIELARELARKHELHHRVDYAVADLNVHEFAENHYDAVFAGQSVHHIANLEHYFAQVKKTLKPGGLFVINEFVGPNQFQWTDLQLQEANALLRSIPEKYRISMSTGNVVDTIGRPTIEQMNAVDPTEAIRSEDILPGIREHFDVVSQHDFGGTLLQLVLNDIAGNFTYSADCRRELDRLFEVEKEVLATTELTADFTLLVAQNNK